ncbi:hypothetical protein Tco_0007048 [Tanacetum coccineum]
MDITKAEQIALDDALVAPANQLKIGKCNLRLSSDLTSKEATLQVVYDVLKLTPFYKAFQASADVTEIYMQEFWATASVHNRSIRFKMNNKKHIVNLEYFREMLQICPVIRNQKFEEPPFEQEILTFLEDFTYQVENKNTKKGNVMYYPRFTKLIINFFMSKDPSIPRRNKINWHYARDDPMFTTINDIQNSESYKKYYDIASGEVPPKTKASVHKKKADSDTTPKEKPPTYPKDKRVKQTGKMTGSGKQKQPATGLETLSEIALTETEQLKIATKRSRIQTLNSQASGSEVLRCTEHHSNSEEESWTFSDDDDDEDDDANKDSDAHDDDDDDDDDDATKSDDDGDNITHPKLSTFSTDDQEEQDDEEEQEEDDEDEEDEMRYLINKEGDVTNVNLEGGDVDMTDADTTKDTEDAYGPPFFSRAVLPLSKPANFIRADLEFQSSSLLLWMKVLRNHSAAASNRVLDILHLDNVNSELDYHLEEVFKATNEQLDWNNPEGTPYHHNLSKPLPLIPNARGCLVIPFDHFINNDLEYLKKGSLSRKYTTSITKTKAADYGQVKWIEDRIPRTLGVWMFTQGDFKRLRRQDIEDMLLLFVQGKLTNLSLDDRYALNVALRMYTRRIVIQERVEDLQLAIESY